MCEVVVRRQYVYAAVRARVPDDRRHGRERLSFAGLHFDDVATGKRERRLQLFVVHVETEHPQRHDGGHRHDLRQRVSVRDGLPKQFVRRVRERGPQGVDVLNRGRSRRGARKERAQSAHGILRQSWCVALNNWGAEGAEGAEKSVEAFRRVLPLPRDLATTQAEDVETGRDEPAPAGFGRATESKSWPERDRLRPLVPRPDAQPVPSAGRAVPRRWIRSSAILRLRASARRPRPRRRTARP